MSEQVRWGILGPGKIAGKFVDGVRHAPNATLQAVASRSIERSRAFASEHQIAQAFGSYEELAESDQIDAVYISSPHNFHREHALLCLERGKAVLCEKPIALNEAQTREMVQCAKAHGAYLMEAMWTRFLPAIRKVKQLVKEGAIGDVHFISASFCYKLKSDVPKPGTVLDPSRAGGALLGVGVYPVSFAQYLLEADPVRIVSTMSKASSGVDLKTFMLADYPGGVSVALHSGVYVPRMQDAFVLGSRGRIEIPVFHRATEFTLHRGDTLETYPCPFEGEGFAAEVEAASADILAGRLENELMSHADMIGVMRTLDEVREQHNFVYPDE